MPAPPHQNSFDGSQPLPGTPETDQPYILRHMSVEDEGDLQLLLRRAAAFADYEADDRWNIVRDLQRRTDRRP